MNSERKQQQKHWKKKLKINQLKEEVEKKIVVNVKVVSLYFSSCRHTLNNNKISENRINIFHLFLNHMRDYLFVSRVAR